jgi:glycosyltransferase involved in cell wall biosynthesis
MTELHGILVTYRRAGDLASMLASLAGQERRPDTLVVVDNDPAESARDVVADYAAGHGRVSYLAAGDNLGPAGGLALGMRHALTYADDADWFVLLDDDDPPRIRDMLARLEEFGNSLRDEDPTVAAVGKSGTNFDISRALCRRIPDSALVGAVPSHCIGGNQLPFYSVHAIRAVGVFDEKLFFGFDDLEYGLRLRAAGFGVYAHGGLWHRDREYLGRLGMVQEPSRRLDQPTWRRYYSMRNMLYILRRHGAHGAALRLAVRGVGKPIYNLPRDPVLALRSLRLNVRAIADGFSGRMGRTVEPVAKR